jgi:NAD(P)H-dependent FMN reductase
VAFSGSLRHASTNSGLVRLAARIAPPELSFTILDWVKDLPWVNPDLEGDLPPVVQRWHDTVRSSDALVIGMPEYNFGPTALAKNALDWLTRPPAARPIAGTTIAFLSSGGRSGGGRSQDAVTQILTLLGATIVVDPPVRLALVADRFDEHGDTSDPEIVEMVGAKLAALVESLTQRGRDTVE